MPNIKIRPKKNWTVLKKYLTDGPRIGLIPDFFEEEKK